MRDKLKTVADLKQWANTKTLQQLLQDQCGIERTSAVLRGTGGVLSNRAASNKLNNAMKVALKEVHKVFQFKKVQVMRDVQ